MTQKIQTLFIDDLDGSEAEGSVAPHGSLGEVFHSGSWCQVKPPGAVAGGLVACQ